MHYGEPLDDQRFEALITPDREIPTVLTADVYGSGEAETPWPSAREGARPAGAAWPGTRSASSAPSATTSTPASARAPRASRASPTRACAAPERYADYLQMATERSLERCGSSHFDLLLLHNPDRIGYTSEAVWDGMQALRDAGLTRMIGVAPGPANGFTLDLIDCFERFGDRIDWAMIILNPLEPWPGELCLDAAAASRTIKVITRVVDYGGLFFDDLLPAKSSSRGTIAASVLPAGSRRAARASSDAPDRRARTADDDSARLPVEPRSPGGAKRRAHLHPGGRSQRAAGRGRSGPRSRRCRLSSASAGRRRGDPRARRQHRLHGAEGRQPCLRGRRAPDGWALDERLDEVARRWRIEPARDLVKA